MGVPSPRLARGWITPSWGLAFRLRHPGVSQKKEGCQTIAVKALVGTGKKIDAAVSTLAAATVVYPAQSSVVGAFSHQRFQFSIDGGKAFNGHAGSIANFGARALCEDVYTDDIGKLYRDTARFEFLGTDIDLGVVFFDSDRRLLGHLQAGAVAIVSGTGGGAGHWR